jgi:hypothetical protein
MTKQSMYVTLTVAAMVPFVGVLTNFAAGAFLGINFLPMSNSNSNVNAAGGFVCWMSFAVTTWVIYKVISRLTNRTSDVK